MKVRYWPHWSEDDADQGSLEDFLSKLKLKQKHPDLFVLARRTIEKAQNPQGFEALRENEYIGKLHEIQEPLWEFRIPPKNRKGGVSEFISSFGKSTRGESSVRTPSLRREWKLQHRRSALQA
ncbi:MAG TPA: hypothetical protein VHE79_03470 [Spirochaetia bacterium]